MGGIDYSISGSVESKCGNYDCCYVEYDDDEKDAIMAFTDMLNRFDIPINDAAVSYTHLDVYKRQISLPTCRPACAPFTPSKSG